MAQPNNWFVSRDAVDYQLWKLLIGIESWDRLGDLVPEGDTP